MLSLTERRAHGKRRRDGQEEGDDGHKVLNVRDAMSAIWQEISSPSAQFNFPPLQKDRIKGMSNGDQSGEDESELNSEPGSRNKCANSEERGRRACPPSCASANC